MIQEAREVIVAKDPNGDVAHVRDKEQNYVDSKALKEDSIRQGKK